MANIQSKTNFNNRPKFSVAIKSDSYQKLINDTLGDKKTAAAFVADITTAVANNSVLANCDAGSILSAGLQAQRLNLPLTNGLGFVYLVPYGNKAQFQISYKGLIQLAQRSGKFEKLGVKEIHEGQVKGYDEFGDEIIEFSREYDNNEIVGYYAYFKLLNGFKKTLYWTKEQCMKHAKTYSKSYGNGSATDLWTNNFDLMSCKTVLKQLLSRYAPLSVEMQQAILSDQAVIQQNGTYSYVDNPSEEETPTQPEIVEEITESAKPEEQPNSEIFNI